MGIFLCMRCAALHRKLGTHISKIKSLSMDTWSSEQVDVSAVRPRYDDELTELALLEHEIAWQPPYEQDLQPTKH
jgi:hypothetical protein